MISLKEKKTLIDFFTNFIHPRIIVLKLINEKISKGLIVTISTASIESLMA